jgi:hypothetical protein
MNQMSFDDDLTGKYVGPDPTESEKESGEIIEIRRRGPIRPGSPEHKMLFAFKAFGRCTAYDASHAVTQDWHALRREARRLYMRGFIRKDGHLPNRAPRGRKKVDAFTLTPEGFAELVRLNTP